MADAAQKVPEISLSEAVSRLVSELPSAIQEFIRGPERDQIAIDLAKKYSLHVDQAGIFQLAYLHMLIGVISPEEFVKTLKDSGIPNETVMALANDVNEMVFKPLREKERTGDINTPSVVSPVLQEPIAPAATKSAPDTTTERTPAPYAGARPQPMAPFNLPGTDAHPDDLFRGSARTVTPMPSAPAPVPPTIVAPKPTPTPIPPPVVAAPVPAAPAQMPVEKSYTPPQPRVESQSALGGTLRTMATDMLAVNEHRAPEPVQYKGSVYTPPTLIEKVAPVVPPPPKPQMPLSAAVFHEAAPPVQSPPRIAVTPSPSSNLVKEYSTDPYREPI